MLESLGLVPPEISSAFKEQGSFKVTFTPSNVVAAPADGQPSEASDCDESDRGVSNEKNDNNPNDCGLWTMVYDEGFDWFYKGKRYMAYFKYIPLPLPEEESDKSKQKARTYCGTTMIGWWSGKWR